ncbi:class I SAM-dependent methyltransferase [Aeromonas sp.]|uniref:class I SAM-dependent methyltransferase n=1 Tax=Aeromonas sp. TaxID=647 RepID=UPI0025873476|nr:class I SAM-dependent methyltransferase [Aeromonas sp.]MCX7132202.1 class I SAM-dependent methyltransferase [Aeromonas sp.]
MSVQVATLDVTKDRYYNIVEELLGYAGITINGSRPYDIRVMNPLFFQRVLQEGSLGLGESYMDNWWTCDRLDMFFDRILSAGLEQRRPRRFGDVIYALSAKIFNKQTRKRAWQVGKEHYDLGNDLFEEMLDPYMQNSCGYWADTDQLEQSQSDKLRLICEKLQLKKGMRLLDIGCGWGGLARFAARHYGCPWSALQYRKSSRSWHKTTARVCQ